MTEIGNGIPSLATYSRDSRVVVDDQGFAKGLPVNPRATRWMRTESDAAKQGRMRNAPPDYVLVGDVALVGSDGPELTDVPQHLVDHFGAVVGKPLVQEL